MVGLDHKRITLAVARQEEVESCGQKHSRSAFDDWSSNTDRLFLIQPQADTPHMGYNSVILETKKESKI